MRTSSRINDEAFVQISHTSAF